jgi:hypothetical protein
MPAIAAALVTFTFTLPAGAASYALKTLYSFCTKDSCANGSDARGGPLLGKNGRLYGANLESGKYGAGSVFALTPKLGKYRFGAIHDFCQFSNCADGSQPNGMLIADVDGNLYGTVLFGGDNNEGAVFMLARSGKSWNFSLLYSFCAKSNCADGAGPVWGLSYKGQSAGQAWDKQSPLFGATLGGGANGLGAAFELVPNGANWDYAVIHNDVSGYDPNPILVDKDGNLLIANQDGGKYDQGVLYRLDHDTWKETTLHNFCAMTNCTDGQNPYGPMVLDSNGDLFGTVLNGGGNRHGAVFERPAGGGYSVIYSFCPVSGCADGWGPNGLSIDASGTLFGATTNGGASEYAGVAYTLALRSGTWVESVIHDFCVKTNCTDGEDPLAPLTIDSSGNLFGVTTLGGSDINCESGEGCGTVFELKKKTPSGEPGSNDLP